MLQARWKWPSESGKIVSKWIQMVDFLPPAMLVYRSVRWTHHHPTMGRFRFSLDLRSFFFLRGSNGWTWPMLKDLFFLVFVSSVDLPGCTMVACIYTLSYTIWAVSLNEFWEFAHKSPWKPCLETFELIRVSWGYRIYLHVFSSHGHGAIIV